MNRIRKMIETEVTIPAKNAQLSGTVCLPQESGVFPTVLMVHGSGNLDRDSNVKQQKLNIFNTFAHFLADNGIASLRYDKRGIGKSTGDYYSAGHSDLVEDAMSCLEILHQNKHCDNQALFLLGHSEGSIIVPQVSQKHITVAGIILLAPFIDTMESIIFKQALGMEEAVRKMSGFKAFFLRIFLTVFNPSKLQKKLIFRVKKSTKDVIYFMLRKFPAKWLRETLALKPQEIYKNTTCPALIIGGSKDVQCDPADVAEITQILMGSVESHLIEDMTHILRKDAEIPSIFNYAALMKKAIEPTVLELTCEWVNRVSKSEKQ